jgi:hypothetical protein
MTPMNSGDLLWAIWWCVGTVCFTAVVITFFRIFHD